MGLSMLSPRLLVRVLLLVSPTALVVWVITGRTAFLDGAIALFVLLLGLLAVLFVRAVSEGE